MNDGETQLQPGTEKRYQAGQDNLQIFGLDINAPVFLTSSFTIIVFVLVALVFQEKATVIFEDIRKWMTSRLDWVFLLTCSLLVVFCLYLIISPLGKVRLGGQQ
ncbi:BCCT family transporter, partial [Candidatus Poribacteria bacterium]|nr:BCCT family transporter [Candidatus Poribacteria bacterium]